MAFSRKFIILPVDTVNCVATLKASATDGDVDDKNTAIKWTVESTGTYNALAYFEMDASTGVLSVIASGLDYETADNFDMNIVGSNSLADIVLVTKVAVHIDVTDFNDNAPIFTSANTIDVNSAYQYDDQVLEVRCPFSDRILHSRMSLIPTPARMKRTCV
jgi:hypothetical protein